MFKINSFEKELSENMENILVKNENIKQDNIINKLSVATDLLNKAAQIFEAAKMNIISDELIDVIQNLSKQASKKQFEAPEWFRTNLKINSRPAKKFIEFVKTNGGSIDIDNETNIIYIKNWKKGKSIYDLWIQDVNNCKEEIAKLESKITNLKRKF